MIKLSRDNKNNLRKNHRINYLQELEMSIFIQIEM